MKCGKPEILPNAKFCQGFWSLVKKVFVGTDGVRKRRIKSFKNFNKLYRLQSTNSLKRDLQTHSFLIAEIWWNNFAVKWDILVNEFIKKKKTVSFRKISLKRYKKVVICWFSRKCYLHASQNFDCRQSEIIDDI